MLKDIKATNEVTEEKDTLGKGGFLWDSDVYPVTIKLAYLDQYPSGAYNVNCIFVDEDGKELEWKEGITNAEGEDFYVDENTGKERILRGMLKANSLCDIALGKTLIELNETPGTVEIYDFDLKERVPQERGLLKQLHGKRVVIGVIREIVDRNAKNDAGKWEPTGKTREASRVDKFFYPDGTTRPEKAAGKPAEFIDKWKAEWKGKVVDRTKAQKGHTPNGPSKGKGKATQPRESLFAK